MCACSEGRLTGCAPRGAGPVIGDSDRGERSDQRPTSTAEVDGPLTSTGPWEPSTYPKWTQTSLLLNITTRINFISNNFNKFRHIINIY